MSVSRRRVRAIVRKELREYQRNRTIVTGMAILPLIFLVQPLVAVLSLNASASSGLAHEHELLYLLAIPALVPAALAAYSVVGERQQGTLEPVLGTPIRREEFCWARPEIRVAQQLGILANLPSVAVTTLIALNAIHPSLAVAVAGAAVLLVLNGLGWRFTSAIFDRERLITGTR
jgi:ABC-type Na+ efflux pump permease subunit